MKFLGQAFQKLEHKQHRQTERERQTDATKRIISHAVFAGDKNTKH